jgi:NAD(P)-dependent dehydrogenase (short-subunit alcohol dehydrogenase family)
LTLRASRVNVYHIMSGVNFSPARARWGERGTIGRWTEADVPDQSGRIAIITGANTGVGFATARVLAERGAHVVFACRDVDAAKAAAARTADAAPSAQVAVMQLDLASLASVRGTTRELLSLYGRIDLLINNAGLMEPPYVQTVDGYELTLATNHLGPFAFTGLLLGRLLETPGSRIVTVSSEGHARGAIDFDDLQSENGYSPEHAYYQSKLANLLFAYELDRRLRAAGVETSSLACHPGIALTNLYRTRSKLERTLLSPRLRLLNFWLAQSRRMGALPTLRAATDPAAQGGEFYGPPGRGYVGYPVRAESSARSHDHEAQRRLWQESERLTDVRYPI